MNEDEKFMARALDLASLGAGRVSPNPMVGCVIVHEGKIVGEGWHERFGGPHAEPNAIKDVKDKSLIKKSTIYVTLEPCSHFGKTPPCVDLLITHMPHRVVVCNTDPNPLVAGKGINKLEEMGIEVQIGVLTQKGRELNKRFFTFHEKQRPYIVLKWAQTKDGFIARKNYESKWISSEESRKLVHTWRSEEEGILVGKTTAKMDNPQLNVRMVEGKDPIRIVIDRNLDLPRTYHIFDKSQTTIIYNQDVEEANEYTQFVRLDFKQNIIPQILEDLYRRKVLSVLVEGGSQTITSFMEIGMWDEARVFTSPNNFGEGIKAPMIFSALHESKQVGEDELTFYLNS